MQYVLISDIHANLEALQAVLDEVRQEHIICLGDTIGYGADPSECIAWMRQLNVPCLLGNHEGVQRDLSRLYQFNSLARESALYTREKLTPEDWQWLNDLPLEFQQGDFYFSHSSPYDPDHFYYLFPGDTGSPFLALSFSRMGQLGVSVAFVGHTHIPGLFTQDSDQVSYTPLSSGMTVQLDSEKRYIINCPSVGQPRNGDPSAQYMKFDDRERTVHLAGCSYDVQKTVKKIQQAGLPQDLGKRLLQGK